MYEGGKSMQGPLSGVFDKEMRVAIGTKIESGF
jgi:hypothetical protein